MVARILKRVAARFPESTQHELRRLFFRRQIRTKKFATDEREYGLLDTFLKTGDWALDIGANIGHYTMRMSQLVGPEGRVIALEPVPDTFALLAANARLFQHRNVSLLNVAASDKSASVGMQIPRFPEGLANYYQAQLTLAPAPLNILTIAIDALALPAIRLAKIDVEGHELAVLRGMRRMLERDHPMLIVETGSQETIDFLGGFDYRIERLTASSNVLCTPKPSGAMAAQRRVQTERP
jgi:FkbM family methyltransferase